MSELNKPLVVLLNAPAGVGKTEAMKYIKARGYNFTYASCKEPLHKATMALFGVPEGRYWEIYNDQGLKEESQPEFSINLPLDEFHKLSGILGYHLLLPDQAYIPSGRISCKEGYICLSIREAMIYTSEVIMKPRFGSEVFGRIRANNLEDGNIYIDDSTAAFDVGGELRADEITPLIERVGQENILLIRIHREGFGFEGDSRRYVKNGVCDNTIDVNNVHEELCYSEISTHILWFLKNNGATEEIGAWRR